MSLQAQFLPLPPTSSSRYTYAISATVTTTNPDPTNVLLTKLDQVPLFEDVAIDADQLSTEQIDILRSTLSGLSEILSQTNEGTPDSLFASVKFAVLSDNGRLELRTPYLGNRPNTISEGDFSDNYLTLSGIVSMITALSRLFSLPTFDSTPQAAVNLMRSWGVVSTVDGSEGTLSVIDEHLIRQHLTEIQTQLATIQTEFASRITTAQVAEQEKKTEADEHPALAGLAAELATADAAREITTAVVPEVGAESEDVTTAPVVGQALPTSELARRQAISYESLWLTNAVLFDLCRQHGISPSQQVMDLLRQETFRLLEGSTQADLRNMFANPAQRVARLQELQERLTQDIPFVQALRSSYDLHIAEIGPKAGKEFADKVNYKPDESMFSVALDPQVLGSDKPEISILNALAPLTRGKTTFESIDATNISTILDSIALGIGGDRFDSYIANLSNAELARLLAPNADGSNLSELTKEINQHRAEIIEILKSYGQMTIYRTSAQTGIDQIATTGALAKTLGLAVGEQPTPQQLTLFRQVMETHGEDVAVAALTNEHPLTSSQVALKELEKQMQKTWPALPEEVQILLYSEFSLDVESNRNPDGKGLAFRPILVGVSIPEAFYHCRKLQEQLDELKVQLTSQENLPDLAKVNDVIKALGPILTEEKANALRAEWQKQVLIQLDHKQQEEVQAALESQQIANIDTLAAAYPEFDLTNPIQVRALIQKLESEEEKGVLATPTQPGEIPQSIAQPKTADVETNQDQNIPAGLAAATLLESGTTDIDQLSDVAPTVAAAQERALADLGQLERREHLEALYQQEAVVWTAAQAAKAQAAEQAETIIYPVIAPSPQQIDQAMEYYNQNVGGGGRFRQLRNFRQKKKTINRARVASNALRKVAAKKASDTVASGAAGTIGGAVGGPIGAIFARGLARLRNKEERKKLGIFLAAMGTAAVLLKGGPVLGGLIGGAAGFLIAGPFGALIGGALGAGIGGIIGALGGGSPASSISSFFQNLGRQLTGQAPTQVGPGATQFGSHLPSQTVGQPFSPHPTAGQPLPGQSAPGQPTPGQTGTVQSTAGQPVSSQPASSWTGRPTSPATAPNPMQGPNQAPGSAAASTTVPSLAAATVGLAALGGLGSAAAFMPVVSIGALMFISLYTLYTIFAAFLAPIPVGTGTSIHNGSGNQYLTLKKTVAPSQIPNIVAGQPVTVTYTVLITPKAGYQIKLLETTDTMKSLPTTPKPPEKRAVWSSPSGTTYITKDSFAPISPEGLITGSAQAQYAIQFTEGVDALVTNTITIRYDVFKTTGETVIANQTFTDHSSLKIGAPKVMCWPTTGPIMQLPCFPPYSGNRSHCRLRENAYDIGHNSSTLPDVYAPIDGTAMKANIDTLFGIHVALHFSMPSDGTPAELVFAHLSEVDPSISRTSFTPIAAGTRLGRMGSTGNSSGPHLHYVIRPRVLDFLQIIPPGGIQPRLGEQVQSCYDH